MTQYALAQDYRFAEPSWIGQDGCPKAATAGTRSKRPRVLELTMTRTL